MRIDFKWIFFGKHAEIRCLGLDLSKEIIIDNENQKII